MPADRNPAFRVVDALSATAFEVGSAVRSARVFHPDGIGFRATVTTRPAADPQDALGVPLLDEPNSYAAAVRVSRGAGLPEPLPDILGVAVRIIDAHGPGAAQDLLFGSSSALPVGRQLLVPNVRFSGAMLSTVLPYRLGDGDRGPFWFGARVLDPVGRLTRLEDFSDAVADVRIELSVADRFGPWRPVADVRLDEQLAAEDSGALRFNVDDNTGGGIAPAGWLQALRQHAYLASQIGRRGR